MWFNSVKYINKQIRIQNNINKGFNKNANKHPWIQLYKHLETNKNQRLMYNQRILNSNYFMMNKFTSFYTSCKDWFYCNATGCPICKNKSRLKSNY